MPVLALAALPFLAAQTQSIPLNLVRSGMSRLMGGAGVSVPLSTKKPRGLTTPPRGTTNLRYGVTYLGGKRVILALGTVGKVAHLYVDANENGDLSDDAPIIWHPRTAKNSGAGNAKFLFGYQGHANQCSVLIIQPNVNTLEVLPDYGLESALTLGKQTVPFVLVDQGGKGFGNSGLPYTRIGFDRRGNGTYSGPGQDYAANLPFTINGTSLLLDAVDVLHGTAKFVGTEPVTEIALPAIIADKYPAPTFSAKTFDGKSIDFPTNTGGNVVLLYAWATWSKPSLTFLDKVRSAYDAHHGEGLSVVGVCLDNESDRETAKAQGATMPWPTVFDGKSWSGPVSQALGLQALPFLLLVDAKSGRIVATMNDLIGDKFEAAIHTALQAPQG